MSQSAPVAPGTPLVQFERLPHELTGVPLEMNRRSEDVRFSPSGRQLLVAATGNHLLLFELDTTTRPLRVEFVSELSSPELAGPHGVDWLSENEIIVANRQGTLALLRLPGLENRGPQGELTLIERVQTDWFGAPGETRLLNGRTIATGPGSVRVHDDVALVCCNHTNTVTAHPITHTPSGPSCGPGLLVASAGIEVPDGVAHSPDGLWFAVSDHDNGRVLIHPVGGGDFIAELTHPALRMPHGMTFDSPGSTLLVADAGSPGLFAFTAIEPGWAASMAHHIPSAVPQQIFDRVQAETPAAVRALEGGIKGIDLAPDGRTVALTCRGQTLAFFEYGRR